MELSGRWNLVGIERMLPCREGWTGDIEQEEQRWPGFMVRTEPQRDRQIGQDLHLVPLAKGNLLFSQQGL